MMMAVCWDRTKFKKCWENHRSRTLVIGLRHLATDKTLTVINAHFQGTPEMLDTRFNQLAASLTALRTQLRPSISRKKYDDNKHSWAIEVVDCPCAPSARGYYHRV